MPFIWTSMGHWVSLKWCQGMTSSISCHTLPLHCTYYFLMVGICSLINILRPRQNGRHFADNIFKCILLNENAWILLKISLKFVREVRINNIPALVQIMAWRRSDDKPLSEPKMVSLLMHICVTQPQWVKPAAMVKIYVISRQNTKSPL